MAQSPSASAPQSPYFTALPYFPDPEDLVRDIARLIDTRMLSNRGPQVQDFEDKLRSFLGDPLRLVTVANATQGLQLTLKALKLPPGSKVITTPFTFIATVHAITNSGLEPVLADIDPDTLCLSPEKVEELLDAKVSAVMPVHVYGNLCDLDGFERIRRRGVKVVYDACHSFGVRYKDRPAAGYGDAEIYSFHATKILSSCEGGAVVSRDEDLIERVKGMTNFGIRGETEVDSIGENAKMSEVHALFGLYSLSRIQQSITERKRVHQQYRAELSDLAAAGTIRFPAEQKGIKPNYQYFPIFFDRQEIRDLVYAQLKVKNIFSRRYFYPNIHHFEPYRDVRRGDLSVADSVSSRVLCLPFHPQLTDRDVAYIAMELKKTLARG